MGDDAAIAEIARMLGALPVVLPASGRCAPIAPEDLSYSGRELDVPVPVIPHERLKTFPDIEPPLSIPRRDPAPSVVELLAPPSAELRAPWATPPAPRPRRWPFAIDALVAIGVAAVVLLQSPLAAHPRARPYADAARAAAARAANATADLATQSFTTAVCRAASTRCASPSP